MLIVLVGHRGTGKTTFLGRIAKYLSDEKQKVIPLDLDAMIEKIQNKDVTSIVKEKGEQGFRQIENACFDQIVERYKDSEKKVIVALGAGFEGKIPEDVHRIWVRRSSDSYGRIFLDRPRMDLDLSPFDEYMQRFEEREDKYLHTYHEVYTVPEGMKTPHYTEQILFGDRLEVVGGILTLLPDNFRDDKRAHEFIEKRMKWGVDYVEIRDDILLASTINKYIKLFPQDKVLFSFRDEPESYWLDYVQREKITWDWPLELGKPPVRFPPIISLHEREAGQTMAAAIDRLERFSGTGAHLKLAVEVNDFQELVAGHKWAQANKEERSFLPCSKNGRWAWYRLLLKGQYKLNFFREGPSLFLDQPYLMDWLRVGPNSIWFGAVLGSPVDHSLTPVKHEVLFAERGLPCLRIPMTRSDWEKGGLKILRELGLTHAAVTSPLKDLAAQACKVKSPIVEKLKTVNSMVWKSVEDAWIGENTDPMGLQALLGEIDGYQTAVWGGGGTLSAVQQMVKGAAYYSARTGEPRVGSKALDSPINLIWGVPRNRQRDCKSPPSHWKPKKIFDLNYSDDSPGREFALEVGAEYVSGLVMFEAQAEAQKKFWKKHDN